MANTLNLNGAWQFRQADELVWLPATVPGCVHTDLRANQRIPDPFWGSNELDLQWIERADWEYRRTFEVPAELLNEEVVELVAEGLDTVATVCLNGRQIAATDNMFIAYRWTVKDLLRPGTNELTVRFASPVEYVRRARPDHDYKPWNDPETVSSRLRKEPCSFGWDWGPRFPTCGIYKALRLEGWSGNRVAACHVRQEHRADGSVVVTAAPQLARPSENARFRVTLALAGSKKSTVAEGLQVTVAQPALWWPNGLGAQPLYEFTLELLDGDRVVDRWTRRLGLRSLVLDRHADEWGESFQFVVNGRPIFAKGANWIPAHSFVASLSRADYQNLLGSAAAANMNMLRLWGGGIYESDDFYDLCDELGILVWHDFIFSCALYPGDDQFLGSVADEVECQLKRLRHHASIALWCGSNELEMDVRGITATPAREKAYLDLFYGVLPRAVAAHDPDRSYWPCSPHNPHDWKQDFNNDDSGDAHYWGVWHARQPVKSYENTKFRFVSEFGMQSYSSPTVAATFAEPAGWNVFAPALENHQKNAAGNLIIFDYLSRLYRFPRDYASLAYLSQLNQAYCMRIAIEHFRRSMPRTMGALYWQLNDCWPVFSWSSLEFGGRWKALHYQARRFFAPALVTAHVPGDEQAGCMNRMQSTIHDVKLWTVYDGPGEFRGQVGWTLYHLDRRILEQGAKPVTLAGNSAVCQADLDFQAAIDQHGRRNLYLRIWLATEDGGVVSENTVFFTAPRFLELRAERLTPEVRKAGKKVLVRLTSQEFHHQVMLELHGHQFRASDNFFELYPGLSREIELELPAGLSLRDVRRQLKVTSLVDSYAAGE